MQPLRQTAAGIRFLAANPRGLRIGYRFRHTSGADPTRKFALHDFTQRFVRNLPPSASSLHDGLALKSLCALRIVDGELGGPSGGGALPAAAVALRLGDRMS